MLDHFNQFILGPHFLFNIKVPPMMVLYPKHKGLDLFNLYGSKDNTANSSGARGHALGHLSNIAVAVEIRNALIISKPSISMKIWCNASAVTPHKFNMLWTGFTRTEATNLTSSRTGSTASAICLPCLSLVTAWVCVDEITGHRDKRLTGRPGVISVQSQPQQIRATQWSRTNYKTCAVIPTVDASHGPNIMLRTTICRTSRYRTSGQDLALRAWRRH